MKVANFLTPYRFACVRREAMKNVTNKGVSNIIFGNELDWMNHKAIFKLRQDSQKFIRSMTKNESNQILDSGLSLFTPVYITVSGDNEQIPGMCEFTESYNKLILCVSAEGDNYNLKENDAMILPPNFNFQTDSVRIDKHACVCVCLLYTNINSIENTAPIYIDIDY